jgi:hypothetical protein
MEFCQPAPPANPASRGDPGLTSQETFDIVGTGSSLTLCRLTDDRRKPFDTYRKPLKQFVVNTKE